MDISGLSFAQRQAALTVISKCIKSRKYFIKEVLGAELEEWQEEVVDWLDGGIKKISVRSGHGVGKTMLCAVLALHFLCFRDDVKVIVTAPSADQMKDGLIPEINKWKAKLPLWMQKSLSATSERMVRYPNDKNNFISFRTARKENPDALAGVHATHVMIIVDEASGVEEAIYETGQGALSTPGAIALLIGNPTNPTGFFHATQTKLSHIWKTKRVSCYDSTQVDHNYIQSILRTYGADSRQFRVRVLGEFPDGSVDAIIPRAFAEAAVGRDIDLIREDAFVWGVDPGRGGDPTGFCERGSNVITDIKELNYTDTMQVVGWVHNRFNHTPYTLRPKKIFVDVIGIGAGVADRLTELGLPDVEVVAVNVSEGSSMSDRFVNLRTELIYAGRDWLERKDTKIESLPLTEKFINELVSINQKFTSTGKAQAESKTEMKRRGMASPNLADGFFLTLADQGAIRIGSYTPTWERIDMSRFKVPGIARVRRH